MALRDLLFDNNLPSLARPYPIPPEAVVRLDLRKNAFGNTALQFVAVSVKKRLLPRGLAKLSRVEQEMLKLAMNKMGQKSLNAIYKAFDDLKDSNITLSSLKENLKSSTSDKYAFQIVTNIAKSLNLTVGSPEAKIDEFKAWFDKNWLDIMTKARSPCQKHSGQLNLCKFDTTAVTINIEVTPVVDRPVINGFEIIFPVPSRLDEIFKAGVKAKTILRAKPFVLKRLVESDDPTKIHALRDLLSKDALQDLFKLLDESDQRTAQIKHSFASDGDKDPLGLAISCRSRGLKFSRIGRWQVKLAGAQVFKDLVELIPAKRQRDCSCFIIINPMDVLKFAPIKALWDSFNTQLEVFARKVKDGRPTGGACLNLRTLNLNGDKNISLNASLIKVNRLGCTGLPDNSTVDKCGKCNGDDQCVGCDGEFNSTAKEICGVCFGGITNKTNPMRLSNNCRKYCDESYTDVCVTECRTKYHNTRYRKDCAGICMGTARPNDCGVCVGGTTGLPYNSGKDACGECKGDNSSCTDCAGNVGGTHEVDDCGVCQDITSATFNKCTKIVHVDPNTIDVNKETKLRVEGSATSFTGVTCLLRHSTTDKEVELTTNGFKTGDQNKVKFELGVPAVSGPVGKFSLECTVKPGDKVVSYENVTIVGDDVTVAAAVPKATPIGKPFTVGVTGTGFMKTGNLRCYLKPRGTFKTYKHYKVKVVSSTKITCSFRAINDRDVHKICLSFSRDVKLCTDFGFSERAPVPLNCMIHRNFRMCVSFDRPVKPIRDCAQLFAKATNDKIITKNTKCEWVYNKRRLCLTKLNTKNIASGVDVAVKYTSIRSDASSSDTTYNTSLGSEVKLRCPAPLKAIIKIKIIGKRTQDSGFKFMFRAKIVCPGKCTIIWSATFLPGATTKNQADLDKLNNWLKSRKRTNIKIPKYLVQANSTYQLTLTVKNDEIGKTAQMTINITRNGVARVIPRFTINVRRTKRGAILSTALSKIKYRVSYRWSCNIRVRTRPSRTLVISKIQVGQITCSVRVSTKVNNIEEFAVESVRFDVTSQPIKCDIKDGNRAVGENDKVKLQATVEDPDDDTQTMKHSWTCQNAQKYPCVNKDGNLTTLPEEKDIEVDMKSIKKQVNETLTFSLTSIKGNRTQSTSVNVTVREGRPPSCKIRTPKDPVDPSKPVRIVGLIKSINNTIEYEWSVVTDEDSTYSFFDLYAVDAIRKQTPLKGTVEGKSRRKPTLIINQDMLAQDATYKFRLTCRDEDGVESYAESELQTLTGLTSGEVYVEPSEGEALNTTFNIGTDGNWEQEEEEEEDEAETPAPVSRKRRSTGDGSDGDSDDGSDDVVPSTLSYQCGLLVDRAGKRKKVYLSDPSSSDFCEVLLPAGRPENNHSLEVFLEACTNDEPIRCALSSTFVTVKPSQAQAKELAESTKNKLAETFQSSAPVSEIKALVFATFEAIRGQKSNTTSDDMVGGESEEDQELSQAISALTKQSFDGMNEKIEGGNIPEDSKDTIMDILVETSSMQSETDTSLTVEDFVGRTLNNLNQLSRVESADGGVVDSSRRKRRAVSESTPVVNSKTPEEVEKTLEVYHNLIKPLVFSTEHMSSKKQFIDILANDGRAMCNGIINGDAARVAQSASTVLRSVKNAFQNVNTTYTQTGCVTCSKFTRKSAEILLGQTLMENYKDWNCDADGCNGACVVSYQMIHDYFLNSSYIGITRASDIVNVLLFNPSTYAPITVSGLASPVKYKIYVSDGIDMNNADLKCHRWDTGINNWTMSGVNTLSKNTAEKSVICSADHLGIIAVFDLKGGFEVVTVAATQAPTTTASVTTTAAAPGATNAAAPGATTGAAPDATNAPVPGATTGAAPGGTNAPVPVATTAAQGGEQTVTTAQSGNQSPGESKTTAATGGDSQPTTKTTKMPQKVSFSLDANFDFFINQSNKDQFQDSFKAQIASKLGVDKSRIVDLTVGKGSIVVTFTLMPSVNDNAASVKDLSDLLQTMVQNGNITLKTPEGKELKVITTSFMIQNPPTSPVPFTTKSPVSDSEGGLKRKELIAIIVGGCLLVVIIVVVVLYCHCKGKKRVKDCDEDVDAMSAQGNENKVLEEDEQTPIELSGLKASLPGSPIYDNIR